MAERSKTADTEARERWLIVQMEEIKREAMERTKPFAEELSDLRTALGPSPIQGPDGRWRKYVGPLPTYTPRGPERIND